MIISLNYEYWQQVLTIAKFAYSVEKGQIKCTITQTGKYWLFFSCLFTCILLNEFLIQKHFRETRSSQGIYTPCILFLLDGVRQFVVVTSIDEIGVPNGDMINVYKYPCVRKFCDEVSVVFGVDLLHVIPVSNYFDEVAPNDAKNAMSLFNLWRVFNSTKEYIERRWLKEETIMISKELTCKKNNV